MQAVHNQHLSAILHRTAALAGWTLLWLSLSLTSPEKAQSSDRASTSDASTEMPAEVLPVQEAPSVDTNSSTAKTHPKDVTSVEVLDECLVADTCIDRFLWVLYQRAPKFDQIQIYETKEVTITERGRSVTVTRRVGAPAESDFGWKDPKAAERAGISLMDYVIGGMDRAFKTKLFYTLYAAEQAGFLPGITSGFRDDYRQGIASGRKARRNMSYHGGSAHGGYGHGLAADVISIKGKDRSERLDSSRLLWNWLDQHAKEFGIGRPYQDYDPPHVAPIDGMEYANHRGGGAKVHRLARNRAHGRVVAHDSGPLKRRRAVRSARS